MGGNVTATNKKTGIQISACKIPLDIIGLDNFRDKFIQIFKYINNDFKNKFGILIWNEEQLDSGFVFNGSTSFIMNPKTTDEVIVFKPSVGDIDIIVPEEIKNELWLYLDSLEGSEILPDVIYHGSNRLTQSSITDQINSLFIVDFDGIKYNCQVDFELLPFENDKPSEWSKFSHNSSIEDAKASIKAVNHKYIIRALVGGASIRDDIIIATKASKFDKIQISKAKADQNPRMLKFSVLRGVGVAYESLGVSLNGKDVFREIPTSKRDYTTNLSEIIKLAFKRFKATDMDLENFNSFLGVLRMMKMYLSPLEVQKTHDRYLEMLWGIGSERGQVLETSSKELDFEVKNSGYQKFIKTFGLKDESKKLIDCYYNTVFKEIK